ncbi:glycosyltransferase family 4 protein [Erythrobacter sp. W53]|uniref:glycosyltransferase family 4 protein n=1 Tax=Erythrobacter sp. W53 TaxID=3425947 RepID=UPI003D76708D
MSIASPSPTGKRVIGYLTSEYPSPSHTFIRREIASLRDQDVAIKTYSIRAPGHAIDNTLEKDAFRETFFILERGVFGLLGDQLAALSSSPLRYFSTLRLALRHRVPGLRAFIWTLFYFVEAITLARQLRRDDVEHLHNHFANPAATVGLLAKTYLDIPWSLTLHGISEFDYPAGNLLPAKLEAARFAACVSHFGRAQAMRLVGPEIWPKLHLVRCAIDLNDLPPADPKTQESDETELICVGRLSPEKGHAGLISVLGTLRAKGVSTRLKLVGDGPQESTLKEIVARADLTDHIEFTGRLDEMSTLAAIAKADILVLPSFMEGLPIVLMEALALGVPAVSTRVAGIPEIIVDSQTGLLFDPGNWADLEVKLRTLIGDAALRAKLSEAGRELVEREFSYPGAAAPLIPLFGSNADQTLSGEQP